MQSKRVGGQGVTRQKLAAARVLRKSPTIEETIVWREIRKNEMAGIHFRRQQVIDGWIVDFFFNRAGVAIEIDGLIHARQAKQDRDRDNALLDKGILVLHFTNEEVHSCLGDVLDRIAVVCLNPFGRGSREQT